MIEPITRYRDLEAKLIHMRWAHRGLECEEEESHIEAMTSLWYELTPEEQATIRAEGPKTLLPDDIHDHANHEMWERDPATGTGTLRREWREVA